jgi:hypothetical protein
MLPKARILKSTLYTVTFDCKCIRALPFENVCQSMRLYDIFSKVLSYNDFLLQIS